jgi:hypothetical protein
MKLREKDPERSCLLPSNQNLQLLVIYIRCIQRPFAELIRPAVAIA